MLKVRDEIEHLLDDDGDMAEMYLTEKMIKQQNEESLSVAGSAASSQRSSLHGDGTIGEAITTITAASSYPEVTLEDTLKHLQVTMQSPDQAPSEHLDLAVEIQPAIPREQKARHPSARDDLSPSRSSLSSMQHVPSILHLILEHTLLRSLWCYHYLFYFYF